MFTPWAAFFSSEGERLLQECIDLALVEDGPELTALGLFPPEARMHAAIRVNVRGEASAAAGARRRTAARRRKRR